MLQQIVLLPVAACTRPYCSSSHPKVTHPARMVIAFVVPIATAPVTMATRDTVVRLVRVLHCSLLQQVAINQISVLTAKFVHKSLLLQAAIF